MLECRIVTDNQNRLLKKNFNSAWARILRNVGDEDAWKCGAHNAVLVVLRRSAEHRRTATLPDLYVMTCRVEKLGEFRYWRLLL